MNNTQDKESPKPSYVLVNDVTGKPPESRKPLVVKAYGLELSLPYPPKSNCKRCNGRGHIGVNFFNKNLIACKKCYPMIKV